MVDTEDPNGDTQDGRHSGGQRATLQRVQHEIALALSSTSDLAEGLERLLAATLQIEGIDSGGVYLVDDADGALSLVCHQGLSPAFIAKTSHFTADTPQARLVATGESIYRRYEEVLPEAKNGTRQREGLRTLAVIPVWYEGRPVAALNLASHSHDEIPAHTRQALEAIAAQVGAGIARIRAEAALRQSRENLQTLFDAVDDLLFILDAEGTILHVNPAVERRLGYPAAELQGQPVTQVHPPERRAEAQEIVAAILAGQADVCPLPLLARDGSQIPVETRITRGQWDGQEVFFGLSRDVSEREQLLHQLIQSAKMAAIGELAAGVAHELNNPLTSVLGFTELALSALPDGHPAQEDLAIVSSEARRARDIVRQLLNFSQQSGSAPEEADLNQVLRETLDLVRRQVEQGGATLIEAYGPDLPLLRLAIGPMKQVFVNLINNALQAMPGGGTMQVRSRRQDGGLVVQIADSGAGIEAADLARVFEPFYSTKPVGQGTGLGLSVSLGIVQEHGGRIDVESRPGEGSTFSVWLPIGGARQPGPVLDEAGEVYE